MPHWLNIPARVWALRKTRHGQGRIALYASIALILLGVGGIIDGRVWSRLDVTPEQHRFGWNEQVAKQEAPAIAAQMPKFAITDNDGNVVSGAGKHAELWKFAKLVNGGKHIPTWRQESGDCVSMGATNALAYRMCFQIAKDGRAESLKTPFPPYIYGISRVQIGKRSLGRSAGSVGAWAVQGCQAYGVETIEHAESLGFRYSGRLADQWGMSGPPQQCIQTASKFRIRTASQVRSWEDVRDAIIYGYPVTVASNVGFAGGSYDRDGKRWLQARGNWGHQMCFIGVEDRSGRTKGAYCLNSWGADAHPRPLNDEPPGGFWVDWQTVQRMVSQGDSWAYSDFDGFPADQVSADWNAFKIHAEAEDLPVTQEQIQAAEQPQEVSTITEVRKNGATYVGAALVCCGCGIGIYGLWATGEHRKARRGRCRSSAANGSDRVNVA